MPTLLEQIETDAAAKLDIPAGTAPAQELARFKDFLKVESHRLKQCHRMGDYSGLEICQARAGLMDVVISALWKGARGTLSPQAQKEFPPMALVALGGYGRSELNPFSDLDIMILHEGLVVAGSRPLPSLSKLMDGILYPLWDLGFKVGHSVRTIAECVQVANKDMQSKTSLIESRLVIGDTRLFQKYQKTVLAKCVEGHEQEYIQARLEDQTARHKKFGNSPTMQEPNIKNGCGGLRDYQNLHWMVYFKYRARTLAEMEERELMSTAERSQLESAYDFLLLVRNELHHQVTRPVDVLSKNLQPKVAMQLGFTDRSPSKRLEQFMREFYTHSRNIYLITRTLEDRLALLPKPTLLPSFRQFIRVPFRTPPAEQVLDGFTFKEGKVFAVSNRVFRDQPRRLMRVFLYAQQRGFKLHPDLVQLMRNELHLVIRSFLQDEHVRETFLEILSQRGNVGPPLRAMHEVGLLGKYMPEFGRLTCLVQHEFYHQYTADEHTLVCLEELDRVWNSNDERVAKYATLFQAVERPHVLYLALLLHDSGKAAHDGKHTEGSSQLAGHAAKRLMLDGVTTHDLRLLIDHHLVMVQVSQRRDLSDPAVIRRFAAQVQTPENLRMLTLHTYADSIATSPKLWNDFKDSLLWELYVRTSQALEGGAVTIRAEEKQKELLAEEVLRNVPRNITQEELDAHFATLPARYFQIHSSKEILQDLTLAHRFMYQQLLEGEKALEPVIAWHNEPDRGYTTVKVCTWDRSGLFSKIAGSFSATGINILTAHVFTRTDGIVLDTFCVTDAVSGNVVKGEDRDKFEGLLIRALLGEEVDFPALIGRQRIRRAYESLEGERIPTRIEFDNDTSPDRTVMDIETEDRLGLLYTVSTVLSELYLNISLAKICTEKGAAIDSFYMGEADGQKIASNELQQEIESRIRAAIEAIPPS